MTNARESNQVFHDDAHDHAQDAKHVADNALPPNRQSYEPMNDFAFDVPTDSVSLPSKAAVYAVDSALHNATRLDIRAMTTREENILTSRALIKKGLMINRLIKSCLVNKRVDPDDLLIGDRNALLVALRITGYGPEYTTVIECAKCGNTCDNEFDLSNIPLKFLDIEPVTPNTNAFNVVLPVSKRTVTFRFLTARDEFELEREAEQKKKVVKSDEDDAVTSRLMRAIVAVDGRTEQHLLSRFIVNMPVRDSRFFRNHIQTHEPGITMRDDFVCPSCGEKSEVDVAIGTSFFWPDA